MKNKLYYGYRSVMRFIKRQMKNPRKRLMVEAAAAAVLVVIIISMIFSGRKVNTEGLKDGVSYIKSLEKRDTAEVEQEIKAIKKAERKAALESGEMDVWQQFNDSVILGDSRAVGFEFYEFLDNARVFADPGATIRKIPEYMDGVKNVNPSTIILCFGLNDISIGLWQTCDEYIEELDQRVEELREALPDAAVFVNSTIPATDPAFAKSEKWRDIPEWNEEIKAHCEEAEIPYIDVTPTVEEHSDLYDIDGIHMRRDFYSYWAITMITEVNEYE